MVLRASLVAQLAKEFCNAGDLGSILGLGRSPVGVHGNPLQYSCLENPTDRGAWWATAHGVAKESDTTERLSMHTRSLGEDPKGEDAAGKCLRHKGGEVISSAKRDAWLAVGAQ